MALAPWEPLYRSLAYVQAETMHARATAHRSPVMSCGVRTAD
jgi:hypothetical protein